MSMACLNKGKPRGEEINVVFKLHRGAFDQPVCPGRGTFASLLSKNVYARGLTEPGEVNLGIDLNKNVSSNVKRFIQYFAWYKCRLAD